MVPRPAIARTLPELLWLDFYSPHNTARLARADRGKCRQILTLADKRPVNSKAQRARARYK